MQNSVDVAVAGDTTGRLIGTASFENGTKPLVGAKVEIDGLCPLGAWSIESQTNEDGFFSIEMPLAPSGPIRTCVSLGSQSGSVTVDASDISLRLTPRPIANVVSLDGDWEFFPDPPEDFWQVGAKLSWRTIRVPSNYEMEGFRAKTDTSAYRKSFEIPSDWAGKRIRLRPEAIYSKAEVWLNGVRVGSHEGGATPFELDMTDAAHPGEENVLTVLVIARSLSAAIDNMSKYAYIEIAGIWRSLAMFCVEPSHVARLTYAVEFDANYRNADLRFEVKVVNESSLATSGQLNLSIIDPTGEVVRLSGLNATVSLEPWQAKSIPLRTTVDNPQQWNAELPRIYKTIASWKAVDQPIALIEQPLGFRQVEIKGRKFSINGQPVRLFGTCLHSSDPLLGRAITPELARKDLELIKEANFNSIRTTHYPPHPLTPFLADQIGIYIEDEGPSCWGEGNEDLRNAPMYVGIISEYLERDRNHPSVVYWSTCNESHYGIIFQLAHRYARYLDPTRPVGGSYAPMETDNDVYVLHYPQTIYSFIDQAKDFPKVTLIDECVGIPHGWGNLAYSQGIDPGMHCLWGWKMLEIRRKIMAAENQMGTMSWAWVDDAFCIQGRGITNSRLEMPQILYANSIYKLPGRGYQGDTVWGMIDGWRRPRPEWWQAKKVYSPVIIEEEPLEIPAKGSPIRVPLENLNWFANLDAYRCDWNIGPHSGQVKASVEPSSKGLIQVEYSGQVQPTDVLTLKWIDETGRLVDAYNLKFQKHPTPEWKMEANAQIQLENDRYLSGARTVYLKGRDSELAFDQTSGGLLWGLKANEIVLQRGPTFHILPSDDPQGVEPKGWKFTSVSHDAGVVRWNGEFGSEFVGGYAIRMDSNGNVEAEYRFTYNGPDLYVRELGLDFELPLAFDQLSWERDSEYSYYPSDHMDRTEGAVLAHPTVSQTAPPVGRPYELDDHPWGCNDFRSTKRGVYWATLENVAGKGIHVVSDGSQHVRASVGVHGISIKVLDFYGGLGGPTSWANEAFHYGTGRLLKTGETVTGKVRFEMK